jgi:hypothetical protein
MWEIRRGWFGRWHIYAIGRIGDDEWWIASFRHRAHADRFVEGPASWPPQPAARGVAGPSTSKQTLRYVQPRK